MKIQSGYIIKSRINALNYNETINLIEEWAKKRDSKYVCICNTHSLVTASNDDDFQKSLEEADLCTPDGMPIVWALKMLGFKSQDRVDGPRLMLDICNRSEKSKIKIYFYGSTNETLENLEKTLINNFPNINIVGKYSPPFRELSLLEEQEIIKNINNSGAEIIFVGLGCPKQEIWMNKHRKNINGVLIGVGAAFDYAIGKIKRPPMFFQKMGLEWFFRLVSEPKRLWKRYAYNNTLFVYKFIKSFKINKLMTYKENNFGSNK